MCGSSIRDSFQDPGAHRIHDSDGSQAPAIWCPGDLQILPWLPAGVGKDAGAEPGSHADAPPWAAASKLSSRVALPSTLSSSVHALGSRSAWKHGPNTPVVLAFRVWVTEGQLDWTPTFSLNVSPLPHPASLPFTCPSGVPTTKVFATYLVWPVPRSLYGNDPHHSFLLAITPTSNLRASWVL